MLALGMFVLSGESGSVESVIAGGGGLVVLQFSRERESEADADGLKTLVTHYGHAGGYVEALDTLRAAALGSDDLPSFMQNHPDLDDRQANLDALVAREGWVVEATDPLVAEQW